MPQDKTAVSLNEKMKNKKHIDFEGTDVIPNSICPFDLFEENLKAKMRTEYLTVEIKFHTTTPEMNEQKQLTDKP